MVLKTLLAIAATSSIASAWMPWDQDLAAFNQTARLNSKRSLPSAKIRGVNLGGQFVTEPWMMSQTWRNMGCNPNNKSPADCSTGQSEFDCMLNTNGGANDAFHNKMANWITPSDIQAIHDAGLNTVRIPVPYYMFPELKYSSEHFPDGHFTYLDPLIQKASDLGLFVVIDLHAAPYAQKVKDAFTGQCAPSANFFNDDQYNRAYSFLDKMTRYIHQHPAYDNTVGIIEVVNEPQRSADSGGFANGEIDTLYSHYYPGAVNAVRSAESDLGTADAKKLHVQFMDKLWLNTQHDPSVHLPDHNNIAFDDHNYVYLGDNKKQGDYMYYTCKTDNRNADGDTPKIVQEFSMTNSGGSGNEFDPSSAKNFYIDWFTAQQQLYEKTNGWIYWTWKTELSDIRWDYQYALKQGVVPNSASALESNAHKDVCCGKWGYC